MPVPDYQEFMMPLMRLVSDQQEHSIRDTAGVLADELDLSDKDRGELLPSGRQMVFVNEFGTRAVFSLLQRAWGLGCLGLQPQVRCLLQ